MSDSDNTARSSNALQFCPWEHFDAEWYAASHMRRIAAGEPTDPLLHYTLLGIARGQSPNPYFDESWYLSTYADVREAVANGAFPSGFAHYCATGYLSRNPHWLFNDHMYRTRRGDLSFKELSGNGLRNGYHHYLIAGQNEGSTGSMFFDPAVLQDIAGIVDVPFTTLLTAPWLGNLKLSHFFDPDWYMAMYEDVEDAIADGLYTCALHHYLCNPTPQHYAGSSDFDEAFYCSRYPDIGEAIQASFDARQRLSPAIS